MGARERWFYGATRTAQAPPHHIHTTPVPTRHVLHMLRMFTDSCWIHNASHSSHLRVRDELIQICVFVGFSGFSMIDIQVAVWMFLLYRWRLFGCKKKGILYLPPAGLEMRPDNAAAHLADGSVRTLGGGKYKIKYFSGTPLITCPPDRVPGKGLCPLHSYFTLASRDAS